MDPDNCCLTTIVDVLENGKAFVGKIPDVERVDGHLLDELHHALHDE